MVRGYVQEFRVTTQLPEPTAKLHQVVAGETAEQLAAQEYGSAVRDGHDLRYYENVLLHVNQQQRRAGITGSYQDPGVLGGGSNNHRHPRERRSVVGARAFLDAVADEPRLAASAFTRALEKSVAFLEATLDGLGSTASSHDAAMQARLSELRQHAFRLLSS